MNGAEPDEIYMGNLTSNVRMLLDTYDQFTHGLGPLLGAVLARYDVRLNTATEEVLVNGGRATGVRVRCADGKTADLHGAGVILATPANIAAALTEPILPGLTRQLRSIAYYPVTLVIAEYEQPIFSSTLRAFVFDGHEAVSNAGAYGVNDLHLVRYTFSGRTFRRCTSEFTDADTLLRVGETALAKYIPVDPRRRRRFVVKRFSPGLCAYAPYHARFIDGVNHELEKVADLHLTGDYMQGASIEACFRSAAACARQLARGSASVHEKREIAR
jgi:oxygen-dependent protoporphyrinogen oxidase